MYFLWLASTNLWQLLDILHIGLLHFAVISITFLQNALCFLIFFGGKWQAIDTFLNLGYNKCFQVGEFRDCSYVRLINSFGKLAPESCPVEVSPIKLRNRKFRQFRYCALLLAFTWLVFWFVFDDDLPSNSWLNFNFCSNNSFSKANCSLLDFSNCSWSTSLKCFAILSMSLSTAVNSSLTLSPHALMSAISSPLAILTLLLSALTSPQRRRLSVRTPYVF